MVQVRQESALSLVAESATSGSADLVAVAHFVLSLRFNVSTSFLRVCFLAPTYCVFKIFSQ